jgi:hypothetical protein
MTGEEEGMEEWEGERGEKESGCKNKNKNKIKKLKKTQRNTRSYYIAYLWNAFSILYGLCSAPSRLLVRCVDKIAESRRRGSCCSIAVVPASVYSWNLPIFAPP